MPNLPRSADTALQNYQCPHCAVPPFHEKRGISCHIRIRHPESAKIPYETLAVVVPATDDTPREEAIVRVTDPEPPARDQNAMLCCRCNKNDFVFKRPLPDMCDPCRSLYVSVEQIQSWKP